jgi:cellobiose phosphorylase
MTAGKDAPCFGEAKNSWLTGTAAWTFVVVSQGIFGIQPDFAGLKIDPCIPKSWPGFKATRKFRGATYEIEVVNPKGVCKGVSKVTVDGVAIAGNVLPILPAGSIAKVVVELG